MGLYGAFLTMIGVGKGYILIVALIASQGLSGCAGTRPYAEIGIGYTLDSNSDWYLETKRDWTCDNHDVFHGEVGLEFPKDWTLGYHHQSHVSCGGPFNSNPELYQDEIILRKKFGGIK